MHRRALLASIGTVAGGTAGLGAGTAAAQSNQSADGDAECEPVSIPVAKSGNQTVATREVPAAWWDQVERSRTVADEIREAYADEPWFVRGGRSSDGEQLCGSSKFVLTVYADDVEAAEAALPERRDGVRIRVEYGDESEWDTRFADDATSDPRTAGDGTPASETPDESTNESDESSATDADGTPGFGVLGTLLGAGVTTTLVARLRDDGGE